MSMSLKNAATLAFIGVLLAAALLVWNFVSDAVNVIQFDWEKEHLDRAKLREHFVEEIMFFKYAKKTA